jgi:hypothetical protein
VVLVAASLLVAACGDTSTTAPVDTTDGEVYLAHALDLLQTYSLHRHEVDWTALRDSVDAVAGHPPTPAAAYGGIRLALALIGERHSFFLEPSVASSPVVPSPDPVSQVVEALSGTEGRFGYVQVGSFGGSSAQADSLAADLQRRIEALDDEGVCGWIVDLRGNIGGNMWPMVAGLGPLIGEGVMGYFVDPDSVRTAWTYADGVAGIDGDGIASVADPYRTRAAQPPVAVLADERTASSGEATFIAFKGRPETFTSGVRTAGLSTGNRGFRLSDGALLVITTTWMADRTGNIYGSSVPVDEQVPGDRTLDVATDNPFRLALAWLAGRPACDGSVAATGSRPTDPR